MSEIRLAPMAGITDWPFRLLCFEQGCDAATTEMISALGYVYAPKNHMQTNQLLEKAPGEGRLFVQIFGKEPELMAQAAARLSALGRYEGVDINMGCPAHKVAASGEGSGLMRDPKKAEAIIHAVVGATDLPVSVKFRLGWDDASKNVEELAVMAEEQGVREIAVHGRTRQQQYSGKADWAAIGRVKRLVHIPVYGNGDIFTPQDAVRMLAETGCDGILVGRGAMGNPWLFGQIKTALRGEEWREPDVNERVAMALRHIELLMSWKPERVAVREMRKHIGWYFHGLRGAAQLRGSINTLPTAQEVREALYRFAEEFSADAGLDAGTRVESRELTVE